MTVAEFMAALGKSVESFENLLLEANKMTQDEKKDEACGMTYPDDRSCNRGQQNESECKRLSPLKQYTIYLDGQHDHIMGEGLYKQEDGDVVIYSDVRKGTSAAIIRNFDYITIFECPEDDETCC